MDFSDYVMSVDKGVIGVTGSRKGGTAEQRSMLKHCIIALNLREHRWLHHGYAQGIDAYAHMVAFGIRDSILVAAHPPVKKRWAAENLPMWPGCIMEHDRNYGERDYDIVLASSVLLACPEYRYGDPRSAHSGTWLTVSFAWREHMPVFVISPLGEIYDYTKPPAGTVGSNGSST